MATLQERKGSFRVLFCWHGKRETFTLGPVSREEAESKTAQVDYLLMRLKQQLISLPPGVDIATFLQFDGKPPMQESPVAAAKLTLVQLREKYLATHEASLEPSTVYGMRLHFNHMTKHFGEAFPIGELSLADLQQYVDRRAKAKGTNGRKLSPATIKKEIVSLRTAWNWGVKMKHLSGRFPYDGLRYPKTSDKPPFMTRKEIERQIAGGGLSKAAKAELWDALYLQADEIAELLKFVKEEATHAFLYPIFCFAAHTGARRSEIIRAGVTDVDLAGNVVTIHERKRVKGRTTTRRVPLSPFLVGVLKDWLAVHPGGPWLFCHADTVERSKKRSSTTGHKDQKLRAKTVQGRLAGVRLRGKLAIGPLTRDEAHDHFKRVLRDSKWEVLRGWHVCRHAFIGVCASKGVDQRFIDEWCGHMTEEQRRRYRHLAPSAQQEALAKAFG